MALNYTPMNRNYTPAPTPFPKAPASVYAPMKAPKPVPTPWNPKPAYASGGDVLSSVAQPKPVGVTMYDKPIGPTLPVPQAKPPSAPQPTGQPQPQQQVSDPLRQAVQDSGDQYVKSAEEIAAEQEAADRASAMEEWQANKGALDNAKVSAKDLLDWAVNTITSSKKPLTDSLNANEAAEKSTLETRKKEEQGYYSEAKQTVLQTYRDLSLKSEKVMRGMGMTDSSRAVEAQDKLNRLLAKDMSQWSDKEVSAYKQIADKVELVTKTYGAKREEVENTAAAKIQKAQLDYEAEVRDIDNNYLINDNAKAAAIREATLRAKQLVANAKVERENRRAELEQQLALMKADVDKTISTSLSTIPELGTLRQGTNSLNGVTLSTGGNVQTPMPTGYMYTGGSEDDLLTRLTSPGYVGGYKIPATV